MDNVIEHLELFQMNLLSWNQAYLEPVVVYGQNKIFPNVCLLVLMEEKKCITEICQP